MRIRLIKALGLTVMLTLSACGGWAPIEDLSNSDRPQYHLVKRGENLFRIAWRYGLDYREIAQWNELASPDRILAGQRLRLSPPGFLARVTSAVTARAPAPQPKRPQPATKPPAKPKPKPQPTTAYSGGPWTWPLQGKVVRAFSPSAPGGKGIQIGASPGTSVKAAANGKIVYKGSGLSGYGRLIIVKHSDSLLSAYGYLGQIFVQEGDTVKKGQIIAKMDTASESRPVLHFEVRKNGRPTNPMPYLSS